MTPKEKAIELVDKFIYENKVTDYVEKNEGGITVKDFKPYQYYYGKIFASICIDEMIEISDDSNEQRFLEEVKYEIEKL